MARPQKQGLDYWNIDVDIFNDDKLVMLVAEFGNAGIGIFVRLMCELYRVGYCYRWGDKDIARFCTKTHTDPKLARDVVNNLINDHFFDVNVYINSGVLTSKAIQKRYLECCKRRQNVKIAPEHNLVNQAKPVNADINGVNADINGVNAAKSDDKYTKESKVKERTLKDPIESVGDSSNSIGDPEAPDTHTHKFESLFEPRPNGNSAATADWHVDNRWLVGGRRPLKRYPEIWSHPEELAEILDTLEAHGLPARSRQEVFRRVQAKLETNRISGKRTDTTCARNWLTGWAMQEVLNETTAAARLETQKNYLNRSEGRT